MARIKTREVDRTSIKTANHAASASHRIRHAGAEIKRVSRREADVQEQSASEYSTSRVEDGMGVAAWKTERAAEVGIAKTSKFAKEKLRERKARTKDAAFDAYGDSYAGDYGMPELLTAGWDYADADYGTGHGFSTPEQRVYAGRESDGRAISRSSARTEYRERTSLNPKEMKPKEGSMSAKSRQVIKTEKYVKSGYVNVGDSQPSYPSFASQNHVKPQESMRNAARNSYQTVKSGESVVRRLAEAVERSAKTAFFSAKSLIAAIAGGGAVAIVIIVICCFLGCVMYFSEGDDRGDYKPMIVTVAEAQLGNEGGKPYWSWYGFEERVDWCAIFVSWCGEQCGYLDVEILPRFAAVSDGAEWFKEKKQWKSSRYTPKAGDIVFFDWEDDGVMDHVGIVEKCENKTVYTIEGNSGDMCRKLQYAVKSEKICGYGVPVYGGITET